MKFNLKSLLEAKEELPTALPEEPISISTEEIALEEPTSEAPINNGCYIMLSDLLNSELEGLSKIKSILSTLESENPSNKEDLVKLMNSVSDEKSIAVGIINKAISLIDENHFEKVSEGEAKAEEVISNNEEITSEEPEEDKEIEEKE